MVVGGAGQLDRVLVGLEAGLVPRILSSRLRKTKSDLTCPLRLLLSLIFLYIAISFLLSLDIVSTFASSPNSRKRARLLLKWPYFEQRLPTVVARCHLPIS